MNMMTPQYLTKLLFSPKRITSQAYSQTDNFSAPKLKTNFLAGNVLTKKVHICMAQKIGLLSLHCFWISLWENMAKMRVRVSLFHVQWMIHLCFQDQTLYCYCIITVSLPECAKNMPLVCRKEMRNWLLGRFVHFV